MSISSLIVLLSKDESLSFITEVLKEPIEINGSFCGELKFTINKKDIDLLVELYEQRADGKYFALSSYLTRASYAKDKSKRQLLQPGKEEVVPINNSYYVSKLVKNGSRIIVRVGAHKKPNWQINYGTGKDVSDETIQDGKVPLYIKWSNESYIKLPINK
jgi:predicted acyl esterase